MSSLQLSQNWPCCAGEECDRLCHLGIFLWLIHKSLRKQAKHEGLLSLIHAWLWIEKRYVSDLIHLTGFHFLHPLNSGEFNGREGVHISIYLFPEGSKSRQRLLHLGMISALFLGCVEALLHSGLGAGPEASGRRHTLHCQGLHRHQGLQSSHAGVSHPPCGQQNPSGEQRWGLSCLSVSHSLGCLFWQKSLGGGVACKSLTVSTHCRFWRNGSCHAGVYGLCSLMPAETGKGIRQQELAGIRSIFLQAQYPCLSEDFWRRLGQHSQWPIPFWHGCACMQHPQQYPHCKFSPEGIKENRKFSFLWRDTEIANVQCSPIYTETFGWIRKENLRERVCLLSCKWINKIMLEGIKNSPNVDSYKRDCFSL